MKKVVFYMEHAQAQVVLEMQTHDFQLTGKAKQYLNVWIVNIDRKVVAEGVSIEAARHRLLKPRINKTLT